jgi:hypothetical protein
MLFPRLRGAFARFGFLAEIGVACVLAAIGPSHAVDMHAKSKAAAPKCAATYEQAIAKGRDLVAKNPAVEFDDYSGDDAAKLLAALNAQPPLTHLLAEHILVVEMAAQDDEDSPTLAMVALVHGGCIANVLRPPHGEWVSFLARTLGDKS